MILIFTCSIKKLKTMKLIDRMIMYKGFDLFNSPIEFRINLIFFENH